MVTLQSHAPVSYAAVRHVADIPTLVVRETIQTGPPKPRLLDRVRQALQARHGSRRTEKASVAWIRRSIIFHGKRHPADMGAAEITQFLSSLAVEGNVAASTQNQALSALLFLYRQVLEQELPWLVPRPGRRAESRRPNAGGMSGREIPPAAPDAGRDGYHRSA